MRRLKLPIIILFSFLLGGLVVCLLLQKQLQVDNSHINNLEAIQKLDNERIALDTDTFLKLFVCLSFVKTCNTNDVLTKVKSSAIQVANIRERRQKLVNQMKLSF